MADAKAKYETMLSDLREDLALVNHEIDTHDSVLIWQKNEAERGKLLAESLRQTFLQRILEGRKLEQQARLAPFYPAHSWRGPPLTQPSKTTITSSFRPEPGYAYLSRAQLTLMQFGHGSLTDEERALREKLVLGRARLADLYDKISHAREMCFELFGVRDDYLTRIHFWEMYTMYWRGEIEENDGWYAFPEHRRASFQVAGSQVAEEFQQRAARQRAELSQKDEEFKRERKETRERDQLGLSIDLRDIDTERKANDRNLREDLQKMSRRASEMNQEQERQESARRAQNANRAWEEQKRQQEARQREQQRQQYARQSGPWSQTNYPGPQGFSFTMPTPRAPVIGMQEAWAAYESGWRDLPSSQSSFWTFATVPWPLQTQPMNPTEITDSAVRAFLLSIRHSPGVDKRMRVRQALLRWHPDKFEKWMKKFGVDEDAVRQGVNAVSRIVNKMKDEIT